MNSKRGSVKSRQSAASKPRLHRASKAKSPSGRIALAKLPRAKSARGERVLTESDREIAVEICDAAIEQWPSGVDRVASGELHSYDEIAVSIGYTPDEAHIAIALARAAWIAVALRGDVRDGEVTRELDVITAAALRDGWEPGMLLPVLAGSGVAS